MEQAKKDFNKEFRVKLPSLLSPPPNDVWKNNREITVCNRAVRAVRHVRHLTMKLS